MSSRPTPKTGLLRQWILLSDRKKFLAITVTAVISVFLVRTILFAKPAAEFEISHTLSTSGSLVDLAPWLPLSPYYPHTQWSCLASHLEDMIPLALSLSGWSGVLTVCRRERDVAAADHS